MKKYFILFIGSLLFITFLNEDVFALVSRKNYFQRPQVGVWFGPTTPFFDSDKKLDTYLGGGAFFRYNTPFSLLKFGVDAAYMVYPSTGVSELQLVPVYPNFIFQLPIDMPLRFQLKAGIGTSYIYLIPDERGQWDPLFMTGFEVSFPAGRSLNIGLRLDYMFLYEKYIDGAKYNGHFINSGITVYFNW